MFCLINKLRVFLIIFIEEALLFKSVFIYLGAKIPIASMNYQIYLFPLGSTVELIFNV